MGTSKRLCVIVHEGDDEAETEARTREAQERALAEHIAAHPEDAGLTVRGFIWLVWLIVHRPQIADDEATAEYVESLRQGTGPALTPRRITHPNERLI
jgi:hypothetical protein